MLSGNLEYTLKTCESPRPPAACYPLQVLFLLLHKFSTALASPPPSNVKSSPSSCLVYKLLPPAGPERGELPSVSLTVTTRSSYFFFILVTGLQSTSGQSLLSIAHHTCRTSIVKADLLSIVCSPSMIGILRCGDLPRNSLVPFGSRSSHTARPFKRRTRNYTKYIHVVLTEEPCTFVIPSAYRRPFYSSKR